MGKNVKNAGMLVLHIGGRLMFTGFSGHGARGEHGTGRYALDLDGVRLLTSGDPPPEQAGLRLGQEGEAVLEALAARYGWEERPHPVEWYAAKVPGRQVGIGIEVGAEGDLVCLPVIGGPGRHECPEIAAPLDLVLTGGLQAPFGVFMRERTAAEQQELRAVVEGLRGALG